MMKNYDNLFASEERVFIAKNYAVPVNQVVDCGENYYIIGFNNNESCTFKLIRLEYGDTIKELTLSNKVSKDFMFPEIVQTIYNSVDSWEMNVYGRDTYCTIYKYTPLGEDYSFDLHLEEGKESYSANDFINALEDYYNSFDIDEEATYWVSTNYLIDGCEVNKEEYL